MTAQTASKVRAVEAVSTVCADLIVLGVRGSGQSGTKNAAAGSEVLKSVEDMTRRAMGRARRTVRLEGLRYAAANPSTFDEYQASVAEGVRNLRSRHRLLGVRCPDSRFAFVGFSQGAQVIHLYAARLTAAKASNVVLVGMLADPMRNPADTIPDWSYAGKAASGAGKADTGLVFGAATRRQAVTFCVAEDEVCNGAAGAVSGTSVTHREFYEQDAAVRFTGELLDAVLRDNGFVAGGG